MNEISAAHISASIFNHTTRIFLPNYNSQYGTNILHYYRQKLEQPDS